MLAALVVTGCGRQVAVPAPDTPAQACASVLLPSVVAGAGMRPTTESGTAAWGEPPITYRCGVQRPPAFNSSSKLLDVSGVAWLPLEASGGTAFIAVTWPTPDNPVFVEVLVPEDYSAPADVLADLSPALAAAG
jgi:hypothetical protein